MTLWDEIENVPALKVPRYCSLVSDKVKRWEVASLSLEQRKEVEQGVHCVRTEGSHV